MTVSGASGFTQTRDEIITDALVNLGVVGPGKSVTDARTAGLLAHASRALNRVVKAMDADGAFLWRTVRASFNAIDLVDPSDGGFIPSDALLNPYTSATEETGKVLDIDEPMTFAPAGMTTSRPIVAMSRDDYMNIADKAQLGEPTRYYVEHTSIGTGGNPFYVRVFVHPIPTTNGDTIAFTAFVRSADFTTGADSPDFPSKWISCLVYGLTAELAPAYKQPNLMGSFRTMFNEEKARLLADDTERGPLTLVPFGAGIY